jgi:sialate O-acetylesterase
MKKILVLISIVLLISCQNDKSVKFELPSIIGQGMVLQRNTETVLWGKANPGQKVTITASWGENSTARADANGVWRTKLSTGEAGGPYDLVFHTKDSTLTINDILIGEVWLCSGQSNMEMPLTGWPPNDTIQNSKKEIAAANYPQIRLFSVARNVAIDPMVNCKGEWKTCSPESVASFSAVAFLFGKQLHLKLGIPVGLINSSWGGTPAEAWTSKEFVKEIPVYAGVVDSLQFAMDEYNAMLGWMSQLETIDIDPGNKMFYAQLDCRDSIYSAQGFDHSAWGKMPVPGLWESSVLPAFDGVVWLRFAFKVTAAMADKKLSLNLGPIDDMDRVYINGQKIGETVESGKWKETRIYPIPSGIIHEGENILAACVIDNTGGGGIYGTEDITIKATNGNSLVLNGDWYYMPVAEVLGDQIYFYSDEKNFTSRPHLKTAIGASTPTTLYNAMISPLVPFAIKGAIWYQGEANVGRGFEYRTLFPAMIRSWRKAWDQGDFPFYYVQIAPWVYWDEELSPAAEVREAQLMTLNLPNTGMVVTTDIGNPNNIHPANKTDVGKRLAFWALAKDYGFDSIVCSGPLYESLSIAGTKAIVHFKYSEGGLIAKGEKLTHFELAGSDQCYYPAEANINGETVEVWSEKVKEPVAVRFGWSAIAEPNLFNNAGLPASPFRTDNWKRLSE